MTQIDIDELKTVSGKPVTISASFRVSIVIYQEALKYCKKKGTTLSQETAKLWREKLENDIKVKKGEN